MMSTVSTNAEADGTGGEFALMCSREVLCCAVYPERDKVLAQMDRAVAIASVYAYALASLPDLLTRGESSPAITPHTPTRH